ncbi:MAG: hypothetical protein WKG00_25225 [Polyangiaceae bacterium]
MELLAAGLGLAVGCSASHPPPVANDGSAPGSRGDGDDKDARDAEGPESGWRSWFGAVVRETLDSTGTFRG